MRWPIEELFAHRLENQIGTFDGRDDGSGVSRQPYRSKSTTNLNRKARASRAASSNSLAIVRHGSSLRYPRYLGITLDHGLHIGDQLARSIGAVEEPSSEMRLDWTGGKE